MTRWVIWKKEKVFAVVGTLLAMIAVVAGICIPVCAQADTPRSEFCVVIDAGHGGIDGGVTGVSTGTPEAEINLAISKKLQKSFESAGISVVMTRSNSAGLYGHATSGMKQKDMKARAEIIRRAAPDLVISIHQNAFPQRSQRGAHVFYRKGSETSLAYAQCVQNQLNANLPASDRTPQVGDYYILNCTDVPAILVECGFISNPEDEANLLNDDYRETVAHHIFLGAMTQFTALDKTPIIKK